MNIVIYSLCLVFLLSACTTISFLPTKDDITYTPTDHIDIYFKEPEEPYIIIGQLIAVSEVSVEEAFEYLKNRAMEIGAHAVIMKTAGESSHISGIPSYWGTTIFSYTTDRLEAFAIRFVNQEK